MNLVLMLLLLIFSTPAKLGGTVMQTPSGPAVNLTWNASKTSGVTYFVYGGLGSGNESSTALNSTGLTTLAYTDQSAIVVAGKTPCYYVKASISGAYSVPSNEWCGAILPGAPGGLGGQTSSSLLPLSITPLPQKCINSATSVLTFTNTTLPAQTGQVEFSYMATPSVSGGTDGVTGLSQGPATSYTNLAAIVRFNPDTGYIDSYNGTSYGTPLTQILYTKQNYRITMVLNITAQTYSSYVNGTLISSNYKFRTPVTSITNFAVVSEAGNVGVCANIAV